MNTTILYLTDSVLDEPLASRVREVIVAAADDTPIISVSQKPLDFGRNLCVGDIGRSWLSLHRQLLLGLESCSSDFVTITEHDVFYTREHLHFIPPTTDSFYCNANHWLVQWGGNHPELNGMYSYWPRREAMSQTIGPRDGWIALTKGILELLDVNNPPADPTMAENLAKARLLARTDRAVQLQRYLKTYHCHFPTIFFRTPHPNLDVRHGQAFTGAKRGKKRCYELPFWGKFSQVLEGKHDL